MVLLQFSLLLLLFIGAAAVPCAGGLGEDLYLNGHSTEDGHVTPRYLGR